MICTGTTAFPSKAWSKNQGEDVTLPVLSALFETKFDKDAAIAKLDADSFNTPKNIDERANLAILEAWKAAAEGRGHHARGEGPPPPKRSVCVGVGHLAQRATRGTSPPCV